MLSLWSALHPGIWVTPGGAGTGSFTIPAGRRVGTSTALTPFSDEETTFWPSSTVVDTRQLGYTYPEFNGLKSGNPEDVRVVIAEIVNRLYGFSVFTDSLATPDLPTEALSSQKTLAPPNLGLYEWTARVECIQYEIPTSYSVAIFLGQVPDDPKEWELSPNHVGSHYGLVNSVAQSCKNCRNNADLVIEGFVHLNQAIIRHSGLQSLEPDAVVPYLTENLHWRVFRADGEDAKLDSLEVTVLATPLTYPSGTVLPVPGEARHYDGITHGRKGGSRHDPSQV